jgi:hypothetical protein
MTSHLAISSSTLLPLTHSTSPEVFLSATFPVEYHLRWAPLFNHHMQLDYQEKMTRWATSHLFDLFRYPSLWITINPAENESEIAALILSISDIEGQSHSIDHSSIVQNRMYLTLINNRSPKLSRIRSSSTYIISRTPASWGITCPLANILNEILRLQVALWHSNFLRHVAWI